MDKILPTLEEMQTVEEDKLLRTIASMNEIYKNRIMACKVTSSKSSPRSMVDLQEFKAGADSLVDMASTGNSRSVRSFSIDYFEPLSSIDSGSENLDGSLNDSAFDQILSNKDNTPSTADSVFIHYSPTSPCLNSLDDHKIDSFLNQNLITFHDILKFMIIGDKGVGKSLLVSQLQSPSGSITYPAPTQT